MSSKGNIHLERLHANRHLGIGVTADPIKLDSLSPGLNLIFGPNGRGKSCVADAALSLLWGQSPDNRSDVVGAINIDGTSHEIGLLGKSTAQQTAMPPNSTAHLYRMGLPELLRADDRHIADEIRRQLLGNLDPATAAINLGFHPTSLNGRLPEWKAFIAARKTHADCLTEQTALARELATESHLRQRLEQIEQQLTATSKWQARLARLAAQDEYDSATKQLATVDPRVAKCTPEDMDRFTRLVEECESLEAQLQTAVAARKKALQERAAAAFENEAPPDGPLLSQMEIQCRRLAELHQRLDLEKRQVCESSDRLVHMEKQRIQVELAAKNAQAALAAIPTPAQLISLDDHLQHYQQLIRSQPEAETNRATTAARINELQNACEQSISAPNLDRWLQAGMPPPKTDGILRAASASEQAASRLERLEIEHDALPAADEDSQASEAVRILSNWLDSVQAVPHRSPPVLGLVLLTIGIIATPFVSWWSAIPALAILAYLTFQLTRAQEKPAPPQEIPPKFLPAHWTLSEAAKMLVRATEAAAAAGSAATSRATLDARIIDAKEAQLKATTEVDRILKEIEKSCGIIPTSADVTTLTYLLQQLSTLAQAHTDNITANTRLDSIKKQISDANQTILESVHVYLPEAPQSPTEAVSRIKSLTSATVAAQQDLDVVNSKTSEARETDRKNLAAQQSTQQQFNSSYAKLATAVQPWDPAPMSSTDIDALQITIQRLKQRAETHATACRNLQQATDLIEHVGRAKERKQSEKTQFIQYRKLSDTTDPTLISQQLQILTAAIPDYKSADDHLRSATLKLAESTALDDPEFSQEATTEEAEEELKSIHLLQAKRDECLESLTRLDQRRLSAQQGTKLQAAEAQLRATKSELELRRNAELKKRLGAMLVDHLIETVPATSAPTLAYAAELFSAFTQNRYSLRVDTTSKQNELLAVDSTNHRIHPLTQLSSGTRVQLILSARMAFIRNQETSTRPPIFLDETLANSDSDRTNAMMSAITKIIETGRQIFYFTAEANEIEDWQRFISTQAPSLPHNLIALAPFAESAISDQLVPFTISSPPPPIPNEKMQAYGIRLSIPPLDPWSLVDDAHLWYVTRSPSELHPLLMSVGNQCGQLLLTQKSTDEPSEVAARIPILNALLQHWRQHRERPLNWPEVLDSGIVTERWKTEIRQAFEKADTCAETFCQEVATIPNFRNANKHALRQYLLEQGFLVDREEPPATPQAIILRLRRDYPDQHADIDVIATKCGAIFNKPNE